MSTMMLPTEVLKAYRASKLKRGASRPSVEFAAALPGAVADTVAQSPLAQKIGSVATYLNPGGNPLEPEAPSIFRDAAQNMIRDPFGLGALDRVISGDAPPEQHTPTTAPPKAAMAKAASTAHTPAAIAAKNGVKSSLFSSEEGGVEPVEKSEPLAFDTSGVRAGASSTTGASVASAAPHNEFAKPSDPFWIEHDKNGKIRWGGGGSQSMGTFQKQGGIQSAFGKTYDSGRPEDPGGFAMGNETETRRLGEIARAAQTQEARNTLGIQQAQAADLQRYGFIPDEKTRNTIIEWEKTAQDDADYKAALDEIGALKGTAPGYDDKWYDEAVRSVQFDHFLKNKAPGGAYMANKKALSPLDAIAGVTNGPG